MLAMHAARGSPQADDIASLVAVKDGLQSLADYAAAALEVIQRLENAAAAARACVRQAKGAKEAEAAQVCVCFHISVFGK